MTERQNTIALAFVGDASYELYLRKTLAETGPRSALALHREAVRYVKAENQALAVRELQKGFLTGEEQALVRYARNHKTPNRSRSANPLDYRLATAFEALLGKLEMDGKRDRAREIMEEAMKIIQGERMDDESGRWDI